MKHTPLREEQERNKKKKQLLTSIKQARCIEQTNPRFSHLQNLKIAKTMEHFTIKRGRMLGACQFQMTAVLSDGRERGVHYCTEKFCFT